MAPREYGMRDQVPAVLPEKASYGNRVHSIGIEVQELGSRVPGMQPALKSLPGSSKEIYGLYAGEVHPVSSLIWVDKLAIFPLRHGSACLSPLGHANPALTRLTRSGSANAKP